jgi:hypothetical protein
MDRDLSHAGRRIGIVNHNVGNPEIKHRGRDTFDRTTLSISVSRNWVWNKFSYVFVLAEDMATASDLSRLPKVEKYREGWPWHALNLSRELPLIVLRC